MAMDGLPLGAGSGWSGRGVDGVVATVQAWAQVGVRRGLLTEMVNSRRTSLHVSVIIPAGEAGQRARMR
jgi:hypothetical protein